MLFERLVKSALALLLLLAGVLLPGQVAAEVRMALVIGMGDYESVPLRNAASDADAVGGALESVGFDVHYVLNRNRDGLLHDLKKFDLQLADKRPDWLVVYYAGHGIQFDGKNYLIPIGAEEFLDRPRDLAVYALELNQIILGYLNHQTRRTFIVLDACRDPGIFDNYDKPGLAGTAIEVDNLNLAFFFATQKDHYAYDGTTGNSPFSQAIVENINTVGQRWEQFIKAVSARTRELTRDFQFGEQIPGYITSGYAHERPFYFVPQQQADPVEECETAWGYVVQSGFQKSYCENFQRQYPQCTKYRKQAIECHNPLENSADADELYADCRRYFRGSGGFTKDVRRARALCEEAVSLTSHSDAAYHLATKHFKLEPCGEKASRFLQIAADSGHKSAIKKLKRCDDRG